MGELKAMLAFPDSILSCTRTYQIASFFFFFATSEKIININSFDQVTSKPKTCTNYGYQSGVLNEGGDFADSLRGISLHMTKKGSARFD